MSNLSDSWWLENKLVIISNNHNNDILNNIMNNITSNNSE